MENKKPIHKRSKKDRKEFSYKNSGVNIDAGNRFVKHIMPMAEKTKRSGVINELGGFGALFDLKAAGYRDPILVATTDGVGTRLN